MLQRVSASVVLLFIVAASGCSATVKTQRLDPKTWQPEGQSVQGVIHYSPALMKVTHEFTKRVDKDGNVVPGTCTKVIQKEEIQVLPDFSRPVALLNEPAPLANSKFSATLSNGMLQSVNSETASVAAELLSAAASVAEVALTPPVAPGDACNAAPQITKVERVEVVSQQP